MFCRHEAKWSACGGPNNVKEEQQLSVFSENTAVTALAGLQVTWLECAGYFIRLEQKWKKQLIIPDNITALGKQEHDDFEWSLKVYLQTYS